MTGPSIVTFVIVMKITDGWNELMLTLVTQPRSVGLSLPRPAAKSVTDDHFWQVRELRR